MKAQTSIDRLALIALGLLLLAMPGTRAMSETTLTDIAIQHYQLISETRIGRFTYEYTYRADAISSSALAYDNVTATLSSSSPYTTIVDGSLDFGSVGPSETKQSTDEFVIRQDRRQTLNWSALTWTVTGVSSDPCAQTNFPCETLSFGSAVVYSTQHDGIVSTVVRDKNQQIFSLDWVPAGNLVNLIITLPGQPSVTHQSIEGGLPTLEEANGSAGTMYGLNASPVLGNKAGCDFIDGPPFPLSCGSHGACCDIHDECIAENCKKPSDSGNWYVCYLKQSAFNSCVDRCENGDNGYPNEVCVSNCQQLSPPCSPSCQKCHDDVVKCNPFAKNDPSGPGPSNCCPDGKTPIDCGKPECCRIDGKTITDRDLCKNHNPPLEPSAACKEPESGPGSSWGDTHLLTFDGLVYDFQAVGEFIFVRSLDDNLEIQARKVPWSRSRVVSVNSALAMNVAGDRVGIYLDRSPMLYVNGVPRVLGGGVTQLPNGGSIEPRQGSYIIVWPDNTSVVVASGGSYLNATVRLPASRLGRVKGLLGNFDGNLVGELVTSEGVFLSARPSFNELYKQYGESWRIAQSASFFDYFDGKTTDTYTDRTFPGGFVTTAVLSDSLRDQARTICLAAGVTDPILLNACILDVGLTSDPSFAESAASVATPKDSIFIDELLGQVEDNPAKSCYEIQQFGVARGNGSYWIKLPSGTFEMHCNFSAAGGGWTRVGTLDTSAGYCGNGALMTDLRVHPDASMAKIPDADAQALMIGTPGSPKELMYFSPTDERYVWHVLENVTDFNTSSKHTSSQFYCSNWQCDNGTVDSSACGTEGEGCPVTAHGIGGFTKKIYVDSNFSRHIRGMHVNGNMCGLPNYERASTWIYVR